MRLAPQEIRTYFITTVTWGRRAILQSDRMASLMIEVLKTQAEKQRMSVHEFVVMPNHIHLVITPAADVSLEKAMQFVKGGFSFRAKKELGFSGEVWQEGYTEKRIIDAADYRE